MTKIALALLATIASSAANADQMGTINQLYLSLGDPSGAGVVKPCMLGPGKLGYSNSECAFGPSVVFNTYNNTDSTIVMQVRCTIYDAAHRVIGSQVVTTSVPAVHPPLGGIDMVRFDITPVPIMGYACTIESIR